MTLEQRVTALEQIVGDEKQDTQELDEHIRKIVNEEIKRSERRFVAAICPPGLLEALAKEFPFLQSDSNEQQKP